MLLCIFWLPKSLVPPKLHLQRNSYPALLISRSSISSGPTSSVPVCLWVTLQHPIACLHLTSPFHKHVSNGFSSKLHTEGHLVTPTRPTPRQTISRVQEWVSQKPDIGKDIGQKLTKSSEWRAAREVYETFKHSSYTQILHYFFLLVSVVTQQRPTQLPHFTQFHLRVSLKALNDLFSTLILHKGDASSSSKANPT